VISGIRQLCLLLKACPKGQAFLFGAGLVVALAKLWPAALSFHE
jgi:hypothetical protein